MCSDYTLQDETEWFWYHPPQTPEVHWAPVGRNTPTTNPKANSIAKNRDNKTINPPATLHKMKSGGRDQVSQAIIQRWTGTDAIIMKSTRVQALGAVALHGTTACTDDASIVLGPLHCGYRLVSRICARTRVHTIVQSSKFMFA